MRNPAGVFIQALAVTTNAPDSAPPSDDHDAGEQVRARTELLPAIQIDAEEDRFEEERESFERERHADDGAGELP